MGKKRKKLYTKKIVVFLLCLLILFNIATSTKEPNKDTVVENDDKAKTVNKGNTDAMKVPYVDADGNVNKAETGAIKVPYVDADNKDDTELTNTEDKTTEVDNLQEEGEGGEKQDVESDATGVVVEVDESTLGEKPDLSKKQEATQLMEGQTTPCGYGQICLGYPTACMGEGVEDHSVAAWGKNSNPIENACFEYCKSLNKPNHATMCASWAFVDLRYMWHAGDKFRETNQWIAGSPDDPSDNIFKSVKTKEEVGEKKEEVVEVEAIEEGELRRRRRLHETDAVAPLPTHRELEEITNRLVNKAKGRRCFIAKELDFLDPKVTEVHYYIQSYYGSFVQEEGVAAPRKAGDKSCLVNEQYVLREKSNCEADCDDFLNKQVKDETDEANAVKTKEIAACKSTCTDPLEETTAATIVLCEGLCKDYKGKCDKHCDETGGKNVTVVTACKGNCNTCAKFDYDKGAKENGKCRLFTLEYSQIMKKGFEDNKSRLTDGFFRKDADFGPKVLTPNWYGGPVGFRCAGDDVMSFKNKAVAELLDAKAADTKLADLKLPDKFEVTVVGKSEGMGLSASNIELTSNDFSDNDKIYVDNLSTIFYKPDYVGGKDNKSPETHLFYQSRPNLYDAEYLNSEKCFVKQNLNTNEGGSWVKVGKEQTTSELTVASSSKSATSIEGKLGTISMSASASKSNKESTGNTTRVQSDNKETWMQASSLRTKYGIKDKCIRKGALDMEFIYIFEMLPVGISTKTQQDKYREFLYTWGSNVITGITTGMSYKSVTSSSDKSTRSAQETKDSSCSDSSASLGISASFRSFLSIGISMKTSSSGCNSANKNNKNFKSDKTTTQQFTISGGTAKNRAALMTGRSLGAIGSHLAESNELYTDVVEFETPRLWDLLYRIFPPGSSNLIRAKNLERIMNNRVTYDQIESRTACVMVNVQPILAGTLKVDKKVKEKIYSTTQCAKECVGECRYWVFQENTSVDEAPEEKKEETETEKGSRAQRNAELYKRNAATKARNRAKNETYQNFLKNPDAKWAKAHPDGLPADEPYETPEKHDTFKGRVDDAQKTNMARFAAKATGAILGTCTIYMGKNPFRGFRERTGFTYGDKKCKDGHEIPKCAKKDKKIIGKKMIDLLYRPESAMICQETCKSSRMCQYFNYSPAKNCELFVSLEKYENTPGWVTGPRICLHVIIDDLFDNPIEKQYMTYSGEETIFDLLEPSAPYAMVYSASQCSDFWKHLGAMRIQDCSLKCREAEECLYFGYGTKQHSKQCYNAGYNCELRTKSVAIDFDIYQILASDVAASSILKPRDLCQGAKGTPYCSRNDDSLCNDPNNGALFADSIYSCAVKCNEKYSSTLIGFSEYNPYDITGAPHGKDRCLCYENVGPSDCKSWLPIDQCKEANQAKDEQCWWDMHFVLENPQDKIGEFLCPGENTFVTSSRPALSRLLVKSMTDCCVSCKERGDCAYAVMEYETNYCYILPAPAATITHRTGWVACTRSGCNGMKKAEKDFHPEEMWWDEREYV